MEKKMVPKEKSLGRMLCRMLTGHRKRQQWAAYEEDEGTVRYCQCQRCGHLFWERVSGPMWAVWSGMIVYSLFGQIVYSFA